MAEQFADYERKDGLFLYQSEWDDLAAICLFWIQNYGMNDRRSLLATRVMEAAHIDGSECVS